MAAHKKKVAGRKVLTAAQKRVRASNGQFVKRASQATKKAPSKRLKTRRKKNVVKGAFPNPSNRTKVASAVELYERFSGHEPRYMETVKLPVTDVAMQVGRITGIMYEAVRDGKKAEYLHQFTGISRPILAASWDGKQLFVIGGKYNFTQDGIRDRKK